MKKTTEKAESLDDTQAEDVRVLFDTIPDGMRVENGVLNVDPERYEVLGKVKAEYNDSSLANLGIWVYPYRSGEKWRYGFCGWQVPLGWVTFTLWAWLSPTAYPCKVTPGSNEDRRRDIELSLRKAGKAIGADLVVAGWGSLTTITVQGGTAVGASTTEFTHAVGYALRVKGDGEAHPEPSKPVQETVPETKKPTKPGPKRKKNDPKSVEL